jgi:HSP20 family protein
MGIIKREHHDVARPESLFRRPLFDLSNWTDWFEETPMKLEEFQEDGNLVVRAELPGIDVDNDVDITVANGTLTIRAERRDETSTEDKSGYRSEFHYGAFVRSVQLPAGATEEDVKATYKDGILDVRVPMDSAQAESKKIPVTRS